MLTYSIDLGMRAAILLAIFVLTEDTSRSKLPFFISRTVSFATLSVSSIGTEIMMMSDFALSSIVPGSTSISFAVFRVLVIERPTIFT